MFESVVERLPVVVLDRAGSTRYVSPAAAALVGYDEPTRPTEFDALLAASDVSRVSGAFVSLVDGEESELRLAFRGPRSDADDVFEATLLDCSDVAAIDGVVVLFSDVSGSARLQRTLRALADPDEEMAGARTHRESVRRILDRASTLNVVELGCYLRDSETATLRPLGGCGDAEPSIREADRSGEPTVVPADSFPLVALPEEGFTGGLAVPMGDYGVLVAGVRRRADVSLELFTFLAVTASVAALALDRLADRRALRDAKRSNRQYRTAYDRLATAVGIERRVERRVYELTSAAAIQRTVCEELVATDPIDLAWFGTVSADEGELVPAAVAGDDDYLSTVSFSPGADESPPAVRVLTERSTVAELDLAGGFESADWRRTALDAGFRSILAVPVGGDDATHGVLAVYAREKGGLAEPIRSVVEHLARTVEYALTSVELRTLSLGNTTVELELSVPGGDTPLADLAAATGSPVRFENASSKRDGRTRVYVTVTTPSGDVAEAVRGVDSVVDLTHLADRDDGTLLEVVFDEETIPEAFASLGATVTDTEATDDEVSVSVTVPRSVDVREFVDSIRESYPGTTLVARRTRDTPVEANLRFRRRLEEQLTDRQLESLQSAHYGGYFESPREHTGTELAESLDITQPTFASHLREAQRKLLTLLFRTT